MLKAKPVEKHEDGYWYHDNNVAGLMIIAFVSGVGVGATIVGFILY